MRRCASRGHSPRLRSMGTSTSLKVVLLIDRFAPSSATIPRFRFWKWHPRMVTPPGPSSFIPEGPSADCEGTRLRTPPEPVKTFPPGKSTRLSVVPHEGHSIGASRSGIERDASSDDPHEGHEYSYSGTVAVSLDEEETVGRLSGAVLQNGNTAAPRHGNAPLRLDSYSDVSFAHRELPDPQPMRRLGD